MPQVVETETREVGFVGGRVPGGAVGAGSAWRVVLLAVTGTGDAATRSLTHSRASTASSTAVGGGDPDEAVADLPTTPGSGWGDIRRRRRMSRAAGRQGRNSSDPIRKVAATRCPPLAEYPPPFPDEPLSGLSEPQPRLHPPHVRCLRRR